MPNAVSCSAWTCCPAGTKCVSLGGGGYSEMFNCTTATGNVIGVDTSVCKPGPIIPPSSTLKNVVVIGDSLSIGYTPYVASLLSDVAQVVHAPADVSDGGAEETAYGIKCLKYFLASPSGIPVSPDVIMFNWGVHDGVMGNGTLPGQNGTATVYGPELQQIVSMLQAFSASTGAKLVFALTTPWMCSLVNDGCVQNHNNVARGIMSAAGIPVVDIYDAIVNQCGPVPQQNCFNASGCWCPHCPAGYSWLASTVIAPALRALL